MTDRMKLFAMTTDRLEDPGTFERYYRDLSAGRREKIDRIRMPQDKKLSLAAGILLDAGLRTYGLREANVRMFSGEHGKPYLPDYPEIHFNLSHSGKMALAVFADTEAGCDIEYRKQPREALARRFFCREEADWLLDAADEKVREERFYRIWTLKESFIKATGQGLRLLLDSFCFTVRDGAEGVTGRKEGETGTLFGQTEAWQREGTEEHPDRGTEPVRVSVPVPEEEIVCLRRKTEISVTQGFDPARYEFEEYVFGEKGEYCAAACLRIAIR